jgi:hypothetical protein
MSACFETDICIDGTKEEVLAMLMVVKSYTSRTKERDVQFDFVNIGGKECKILDNMSDVEIKSFVESLSGSSVVIEAEGPYGRFYGIENCGLFEDMASAAPNAWLDGSIAGFTNGGNQYMKGELKDGTLYLKYEYGGDVGREKYVDYVIEKLPYQNFVNIFNIDSVKFDEKMYKEFIDECWQDFNYYLDYEKFIERCRHSVIRKTEYSKAVKKIKKLKIMSYDEYSLVRGESIYAPVERKYLKDGRIFGNNPVSFNLSQGC